LSAGGASSANEGTSGTVIALSTIVSVLACCGVLFFLYRRRYGQKEEDEKELSPYERWMRNEENKGGMDQGGFRMSGGQGMDVADIYGNNQSTHNPMGGSPGGIDYYGNPQMMMQGGDPRMSGMSNMSGGQMGMMPPGMDPRMSGMSNPGMMPPQGMNGSTHKPMMGNGGQDSLHMPPGGMMNSTQQMDDYDYQMDGQQGQSPPSGKQNPLVRQYRQSLAGRRGGGR
jgi:hypothetical protein